MGLVFQDDDPLEALNAVENGELPMGATEVVDVLAAPDSGAQRWGTTDAGGPPCPMQ